MKLPHGGEQSRHLLILKQCNPHSHHCSYNHFIYTTTKQNEEAFILSTYKSKIKI